MIERPNDLHAWHIYKEQWVCLDCGCCDDPNCSRCRGRIDPEKECPEVKKDNPDSGNEGNG